MEGIEAIYTHAVDILSEVSIKLKHLEVLNILADQGIPGPLLERLSDIHREMEGK